jgi:hypothetical protein
MSVRRIKNHGKWIWQARVAYRGLRKAAFRPSKEEAREAESELVRELKQRVGEAEQAGSRPVTMKALFEFYVGDLDARGKGADTIGRVASTAKAMERLMPALLATPVSRVRDRDIYDFRQALAREGKAVSELVAGERVERYVPAKPSSINRDLRTLRAMLKLARPTSAFQAPRSTRRTRRGSGGCGPRRRFSCWRRSRHRSGIWRSWRRSLSCARASCAPFAVNTSTSSRGW